MQSGQLDHAGWGQGYVVGVGGQQVGRGVGLFEEAKDLLAGLAALPQSVGDFLDLGPAEQRLVQLDGQGNHIGVEPGTLDPVEQLSQAAGSVGSGK